MYDAGRTGSGSAGEESEEGSCEGSALCGSASTCGVSPSVELSRNIKLLLAVLMSGSCSPEATDLRHERLGLFHHIESTSPANTTYASVATSIWASDNLFAPR
jgi:hypothetical protein